MERNVGISALRAISMCLIVVCHLLQYYGNEWAWWCNIGVQLFLVISGFLYGCKRIDNSIGFLKKNFSKLLADYYLYLLLLIPFYYLLYPSALNGSSIIYLCLGFGKVQGLGHLWFVSTILICYGLTPLLQRIHETHNSLCTLFVLLVIVEITFLPMQLFGLVTGAWINCYILGYWIGGANYSERARYKNLLTPLTVVLICTEVSTKYLFHLSMSGLLLYAFNELFHYGRVALAGATLLTFVPWASQVIKDNKIVGCILNFTDKYSYDVYLCHHVYILGPLSLLNVFGGTGVLFVLTATIASSICLRRLVLLLQKKACEKHWQKG